MQLHVLTFSNKKAAYIQAAFSICFISLILEHLFPASARSLVSALAECVMKAPENEEERPVCSKRKTRKKSYAEVAE